MEERLGGGGGEGRGKARSEVVRSEWKDELDVVIYVESYSQFTIWVRARVRVKVE